MARRTRWARTGQQFNVRPAGTRNVYRVFGNRVAANHRYMIDPAIRETTIAKSWLPEGDGPDRVVMCSPL